MFSAPLWEGSQIFAAKLDCVPLDMPPFQGAFREKRLPTTIARFCKACSLEIRAGENRAKWHLEDTVNKICDQQQSLYPLSASQHRETDRRTDEWTDRHTEAVHMLSQYLGAKQVALGAMEEGRKHLWSK